MSKLHSIALVSVVTVWVLSGTWTRGGPMLALPILFAFYFGFVLGVIYSDQPDTKGRPADTFWLIMGGVFGLFLGTVIGIIQWIAHGEWLTSAFLTDCAFGLAFGLLLGLRRRAMRDLGSPGTNQ